MSVELVVLVVVVVVVASLLSAAAVEGEGPAPEGIRIPLAPWMARGGVVAVKEERRRRCGMVAAMGPHRCRPHQSR